jgi:hypothetical protein
MPSPLFINLAGMQRIELCSQGFGDLRITTFLHPCVILLWCRHEDSNSGHLHYK